MALDVNYNPIGDFCRKADYKYDNEIRNTSFHIYKVL